MGSHVRAYPPLGGVGGSQRKGRVRLRRWSKAKGTSIGEDWEDEKERDGGMQRNARMKEETNKCSGRRSWVRGCLHCLREGGWLLGFYLY